MNTSLRAALIAATLLTPVLAHAQAPGPSASHAVVPPIPFTERTLANGLHVFAARDTSTPNVTVQVWYGVGSKDDPEGRSGFAHLFEHMMFKATRDMPAEHMDRLTEDVGGMNNASTWPDFTDFYEVIPAKPSGGLAVGRGRTNELAVGGSGQFRFRTGGGGGGVAPKLPRQSLRPPVPRHPGCVLHHPPLQALHHRLHRRSRCGDPARREGLPRHLLPAQQRQSDRGRQLRPEDLGRLDRQVFRRHRQSKPARPPRHRGRAAAHRAKDRHRLRAERPPAGSGHHLGHSRRVEPGSGGAARFWTACFPPATPAV